MTKWQTQRKRRQLTAELAAPSVSATSRQSTPSTIPNVAATGRGHLGPRTPRQRYLDFAGGIGVLNVGQRHPKVVAALCTSRSTACCTRARLVREGYVKLAARIAEKVSPGGSHQTCF